MLMKLFKTLLLIAAIPALSISAYAGGSCGGDGKCSKGEKEKASTVNIESLCSCKGDKGGDKDKEKA
mgnify:CR=1 FL=1